MVRNLNSKICSDLKYVQIQNLFKFENLFISKICSYSKSVQIQKMFNSKIYSIQKMFNFKIIQYSKFVSKFEIICTFLICSI
jgi:hypothetical protein